MSLWPEYWLLRYRLRQYFALTIITMELDYGTDHDIDDYKYDE
jgi:hypothetical protein